MGREPWLPWLLRRSGRKARQALPSLVLAWVAFAACTTKESNGSSSCSAVCACEKGASNDSNVEKTCLEQCSTATKGASDPLVACAKSVTETGFPQCVYACKAFAPAEQDQGACKGYRATSREQCTWDGTRVLADDQSCFQTIGAELSGYCECGTAGNWVHIDCGHAEGTCEQACQQGYFGDFTPPATGTGGARGSGGGTSDASSGGQNGTGGAGGQVSEAGDPCSGYLDAIPYTYACGANLGVDPNRLYRCNNGVTEGYVVCPNGCAAAPPGQPNYCYGTDPCINAPIDDDICGSNLGNPSAEQNTLYTCLGGVTQAKSPCASGTCNPSADAKTDSCQ